jgi:hypothetical protein
MLALLIGAAAWTVEPTSMPKEYLAKLTAAEPTAEAQFRLANLARRLGMKDVADGHLRAAVRIDPQFVAAHKALGRTLKSGVWETKDENRSRLAREATMRSERAAWQSSLAERGIEATVAERTLTEGGAATIEEFAAPDARRSAEAVNAFRGSQHAAATVALVRQAVASRFPEVREAAAEALTERNPDHVLPALIEYLKPQRSGSTVVLGVGEIWYWQEGSRMFLALPAAAGVRASLPTLGGAGGVRETMVGRNAQTEFERGNAVAALQKATGKKIGDDYPAWRNVVMQATDSFVDAQPRAATSTTAVYYRPEVTTIGTATLGTSTRYECFAAGTLVAAKRGTIPIDHVCLGELVLSQNVETGEVAYKPVLARTLRPRTEMRELSFAGETLTATLAHHFWLTDGGWTKAKDLRPGAALRTSDGEVALSSNAPGEPAQAYNLVVADFGTYFVGKAKVLVHDNSPIRDAAPARK